MRLYKKQFIVILALMLFNVISHTHALEDLHEEDGYLTSSYNYQYFKNCIYDNMSSLVTYYENQSLYLRGFGLIVMIFREYMLHFRHLNVESKLNVALEFTVVASHLPLLIYDAYVDWVDWDVTENNNVLRYINKDGLISFEFPYELLSSNHLYHKLSHQLDMEIFQITIATIDDQFYAIVKYRKGNTIERKAINLIFNYNFHGVYFVELSCIEGHDHDEQELLPLSIFSEEVINQIFILINGVVADNIFNESFVIGEHFSANKEMFIRRLEAYPNSTNTFSTCIKSTKKIFILEKQLNNSKDALIEEVLTKLDNNEYGWLSYVSWLFFKQLEHIFSTQLVITSSQYIFSGNCAICLGHMSLSIDVAGCGKHWFCTVCLLKNIRQGNKRCPLCNG